MKLVVESGATKSTWVLLDSNKVTDTKVLSGINPTSNPASVTYVSEYDAPSEMIKQVYFYGAGVSNAAAKTSLRKALESKFQHCELTLGHDILAAALSVSYGRPSIVNILGTGTNTVVFDGEGILESRKALGYLFADYGSGFHLGKILIQKYFRNEMAESDHDLFYKEYIVGQDDILFRIYKAAKPNFETARLSYFLSTCSKQLRKEVVTEAFSDFFEYQIVPLKNGKDYKLNFVGSISEVFESELRSVARLKGYEVDKIVGNPIDGLIEYHKKID